MTRPIDHTQLEREQRISRLQAAIMDGDPAEIEAALAAVQNSACLREHQRIQKEWPPIDALNQEQQADHDDEREFGWSLPERGD